ncbi:MAG: hypothetical protein EOO24_11090, partial [Comamonadaceae bacterium]
MLIQRARLHPLEVPMSRPIKMAGETLTHAQTLLVCLTDEEGREGWGEASAAPLMTGETLASLAASTEYLASRLLGMPIGSPADIGALHDGVLYANSSAKAAHETALMDLFARRAGLPLHVLLRTLVDREPGRRHPPQPLEMLHMLASGDLDGELDEARRLRAEGIRHWKIKVGSGRVEEDVRRVRTLCEALAGDVVSADANTALSPEAASAIAIAGRESGLAFLEQPFRTDMTESMARLHAATGLPMCADESIHGQADILRHRDAGAAQGASLKLIKFGGTRALAEAGRLC